MLPNRFREEETDILAGSEGVANEGRGDLDQGGIDPSDRRIGGGNLDGVTSAGIDQQRKFGDQPVGLFPTMDGGPVVGSDDKDELSLRIGLLQENSKSLT